MSDSKNDLAWTKIFADFPIIQDIEKNGFFNITSEQINCYREARLMTKFDVQRKEAISKVLTAEQNSKFLEIVKDQQFKGRE